LEVFESKPEFAGVGVRRKWKQKAVEIILNKVAPSLYLN